MTAETKEQRLAKVDRLIVEYFANPNIVAALLKYRDELAPPPRPTIMQRVRRFFGAAS